MRPIILILALLCTAPSGAVQLAPPTVRVEVPVLPCDGDSQCVVPSETACDSETACRDWASGFMYYLDYMYFAYPGGGACVAIVEGPWLPWRRERAKRIAFINAAC